MEIKFPLLWFPKIKVNFLPKWKVTGIQNFHLTPESLVSAKAIVQRFSNEITLILFVVVRDVGDVFADEGC